MYSAWGKRNDNEENVLVKLLGSFWRRQDVKKRKKEKK